MKKLAILGGTFDPVTNAHIEIARNIRDKYDLDILFLPSKNTRWKDDISDASHRLNMLKVALKSEDRITYSDFEIVNTKDDETNYSIDTIYKFIEANKDTEIYYIIGSDQLDLLDKWKDVEELSQLVKFLIVEREGYPINDINLGLFNCINTDIKIKNISSTDIRNHKSNDTKRCVLNYIKKNGLYINDILKGMVEKERYEHSLRVAKLSKEIALSNKMDGNKAYLAGLIHDCAKRTPFDKATQLMLKYYPEHIGDNKGLYHQYLAPIIAKEAFGIDDEEVFEAIRFHATAKEEMSKLAKVIYCADKLEEGRGYDSSFNINLCKEDIEVGYYYELKANTDYVKSKGVKTALNDKLNKQASDFIKKFELNKIYKVLDDKITTDICLYDVNEYNVIYNYVFVATAASQRQLVAIIDEIEDLVAKYHISYHHKEVQFKSGWVLIDLCDVIVHVFTKDARIDYALDEIYKDAPKIKIGD